MSLISRLNVCAGARSAGVQIRIDTAAINASGTLTVKIDCQPKALTKSPPMTGPTAVVEKAETVMMPNTMRGGFEPVASPRSRKIRIAAG